MKKREIQPLGNHVLIQPIVPEEQSIGGIVLPEQWKQPSGEGTVIAVGPGKLNGRGDLVPIPVKSGDQVMFNWIQGREIKADGKTLRLLDADELLGVIKVLV